MINDLSAVVINVVLLVHYTFYMNATLYMNTSVSFTKIALSIIFNSGKTCKTQPYSDFCCQKKGLFIATSCKSFKCFVIVALNRSVCRFLGRTLNIVSSCSPKSSSISRSASSSTYTIKHR